jgi:hypothetical protein
MVASFIREFAQSYNSSNITPVLRFLILNLNRKSKPLTTILQNERDNEPVNLESQMEIDN